MPTNAHPEKEIDHQEAFEPALEGSRPFLLEPILIIGLGRSGTSLLMSQLARDHRILFDRTFPFETRVLSTIAKFCRTFPRVSLYGLSLNIELWNSQVKEQSNLCLASGDKSSDLKVDEAQLLVSQWSSISSLSLKNNREAKFYAEKSWIWLPTFLQGKLPACFLFIFRDPKDTFLSAQSFSKKTSSNMLSDYSHAPAGTESLGFMYQVCIYYETFLALRKKNKAALIRYEDLVTDSDSTIEQLRQLFGFQPSEPLDIGSYEQHSTTASPESSIGRWKAEAIDRLDLFHMDCIAPELLSELNYKPARKDYSNSVLTKYFEESKSSCFAVEGATASYSEAEGLNLHFTSPSACLFVKGLDYAQQAIREIWLSTTVNTLSPLTLQWRSADEEFTPDRSVSSHENLYEPNTIMRFDVSSSPLWSDNFAELKISGWQCGDSEETIVSCRWLKIIPKGQSVQTAEPPHPASSFQKTREFIRKLVCPPVKT